MLVELCDFSLKVPFGGGTVAPKEVRVAKGYSATDDLKEVFVDKNCLNPHLDFLPGCVVSSDFDKVAAGGLQATNDVDLVPGRHVVGDELEHGLNVPPVLDDVIANGATSAAEGIQLYRHHGLVDHEQVCEMWNIRNPATCSTRHHRRRHALPHVVV